MEKNIISVKPIFFSQLIACVCVLTYYSPLFDGIEIIDSYLANYIIESISPTLFNISFLLSFIYLGTNIYFSRLRDRGEKMVVPNNIRRTLKIVQSVIGVAAGVFIADSIYWSVIHVNYEYAYGSFLYYLVAMLMILVYTSIFNSVITEKYKITQNMFSKDMRKGFRFLGLAFIIIPITVISIEIIRMA